MGLSGLDSFIGQFFLIVMFLLQHAIRILELVRKKGFVRCHTKLLNWVRNFKLIRFYN